MSSVRIKPTEKQIYETFERKWLRPNPEARKIADYGTCSSRILLLCSRGLTETLGMLAVCPLTVSIPILSFNHSSVWIIWFRSSLTQTYCRSPSSYSILHSSPNSKALSWGMVIFLTYKTRSSLNPRQKAMKFVSLLIWFSASLKRNKCVHVCSVAVSLMKSWLINVTSVSQV